ncbi:RecB family exonuclease [Dietzia sp.]|uniref:RecB family exonuclease n=1 Tax=Dietzia sp. TaxID=1871616 RepID=UPI002FDA3482
MSSSSESAEARPRRPKPLALSASRAADYRQCPLVYRFRAIDKLPEPKTRAQVLGTTVHTALENLYALPQEKRTAAEAKRLAEAEAETAVAEGGIAADVIAPEDTARFRSDAAGLVRGLYVVEDPTRFSPHSCEDYLLTATAGGTPLHGFVDRIDIAPTGEVRVVDYKTGKLPRPGYESGPLAQMRFYALMYFLLQKEIPAQLKLIYLKAGSSLTLSPDEHMLSRTADELDSLWEQIERDGENGTFEPKTSKLCGWCDHKAHCPAFGGEAPEYPGWPGTRKVNA